MLNLPSKARAASLSLVIILFVTLVLAGCGGPKAKEPVVAVYGLGSEDPVVFWDPADACTNEVIVLNEMYETLIRYDPGTDSFQNILATDYTKSSDGLEWTFHLRQGVKFHGSGNVMTSEDVKYSIDRAIQRGGGVTYIWDPVKEIATPDVSTVVFKLKYPAALDMIVASSYGAHIVDSKVVKAQPEDWLSQGNDAGTGPYMLETWQKGGDYVLTKFPDYWGGWSGKHFDKVVYKQIPDSNTRSQMLESGEITVEVLTTEEIQVLKDKPSVKIVSAPSWKTMIAPLNTAKKPLSNKLVRQALAYAVPYQDLVNTAYGGTAVQPRGVVPESLWGYSKDVFQYSYNLEKAKQLLAQAGYPNGGVKILLTYPAGSTEIERMVQLWKSSLAQIGVDMELRGMQWEQQWDLAKNPDPAKRQDITIFTWFPAYPDPYDNFVNLFHSEDSPFYNLSYYKNPTVDDLMSRARELSGTDRPAAIQLYKQAQDILMEDIPQIHLVDRQEIVGLRADLQGYTPNPAYSDVMFFYNIQPGK